MHAVFPARKHSLSCSEPPRLSRSKIAPFCIQKIPPFVVMKPESVVSGIQYTHSYYWLLGQNRLDTKCTYVERSTRPCCL